MKAGRRRDLAITEVVGGQIGHFQFVELFDDKTDLWFLIFLGSNKLVQKICTISNAVPLEVLAMSTCTTQMKELKLFYQIVIAIVLLLLVSITCFCFPSLTAIRIPCFPALLSFSLSLFLSSPSFASLSSPLISCLCIAHAIVRTVHKQFSPSLPLLFALHSSHALCLSACLSFFARAPSLLARALSFFSFFSSSLPLILSFSHSLILSFAHLFLFLSLPSLPLSSFSAFSLGPQLTTCAQVRRSSERSRSGRRRKEKKARHPGQ